MMPFSSLILLTMGKALSSILQGGSYETCCITPQDLTISNWMYRHSREVVYRTTTVLFVIAAKYLLANMRTIAQRPLQQLDRLDYG